MSDDPINQWACKMRLSATQTPGCDTMDDGAGDVVVREHGLSWACRGVTVPLSGQHALDKRWNGLTRPAMPVIEVWLVTSENGFAKGCGLVLRDSATPAPPSGELLGSVRTTGAWDLWDDGYGDAGLTVGVGDDRRQISSDAVIPCAQRGMFGLSWIPAKPDESWDNVLFADSCVVTEDRDE